MLADHAAAAVSTVMRVLQELRTKSVQAHLTNAATCVQCIVANLIGKRLVKGYVALPQQVLVVQKGGPAAAFPPIVSVNWR